MKNQQVSLSPKVLLGAINKNLEHHFLNSSRESAKLLFQTILKGETSPFMRIDMGDAGEVHCELSLDEAAYVGKLNFGKFKKSVAVMTSDISQHLDTDTAINSINNDKGEIRFNIPGIVEESDGQRNVIIVSFRQLGAGLASVKLMFLAPDEYANT